jgi:hypothetical protein
MKNPAALIHIILGQKSPNAKCDDQSVNMHMLECYKQNIDETIDSSLVENAYFMDGSLLCQFEYLFFLFF